MVTVTVMAIAKAMVTASGEVGKGCDDGNHYKTLAMATVMVRAMVRVAVKAMAVSTVVATAMAMAMLGIKYPSSMKPVPGAPPLPIT